MKPFPKVRRENLVTRELGDELLIYDKDRHEAHCLNRTAALIWKHCDGRTSVEQITSRVGKEINGNLETPIDERLVWYAINQFKRDHLLEDKVEIPKAVLASVNGQLNRRQVIRTLGLTALVALPLVTSIVAPTAAQAATCTPSGGACTSGLTCCKFICNAGVCA